MAYYHKKILMRNWLFSSISLCFGTMIAINSLHASPAVPRVGEDFVHSEMIYKRIQDNPVLLEIFLRDFPKGADLHNHLVGAIYAESFLRWAAEDELCVEVNKGLISPKKCLPSTSSHLAPEMPASSLIYNETAWNMMIDALSMRDFTPSEHDRSGHDHFFATFDGFEAVTDKHQGDMLAEALTHAADDHVHYLELMISPALGEMIHAGIGHKVPTDETLDAFDELLMPLMPDIIKDARQAVDQMEQDADKTLHCGTAQAAPGCFVQKKYLYQSIRSVPPQLLYPQLLAAYLLAKEDARFVGINIVAPEDDPISMHDYALHMKFFAHLNKKFPGIHLSLHAGELTPSLVGPEGVKDHIWQAVTVAGAQRIGHGVDILWEHDPQKLLALMASQKIMVEINLSSNEQILGISGQAHPLPLYLQNHVPVALSTDDEGVSRGSLTKEYLNAAQRYHLSYKDLISLSRTSLEYSFLEGYSLWIGHDFGKMTPQCHVTEIVLPLEKISSLCRQFLSANAKASAEWGLEKSFFEFDQEVAHNPLFMLPKKG